MPEASVAWTQPAAITTDHVLDVGPRPVLTAGEGGAAMAPIHFSVVYRLGEYLQLLREHLTLRLLARARERGRGRDGLSRRDRLTMAVLLPVLGAPIFWRKKRLMPVCRFTIDDQGLVRETRLGTLRVAWDDVVAVHRHSAAWLVDKGRGALPVPHRCLDEAQRAAFERLLLSRFPDGTPV